MVGARLFQIVQSTRSAARVLVAAAVVGAVFAIGVLAGQRSGPTPAARAAGLWADVCFYRIRDETDQYGTYTVVSAIVYDYGLFGGRTRGVLDYAARQAVASFDCERRW